MPAIRKWFFCCPIVFIAIARPQEHRRTSSTIASDGPCGPRNFAVVGNRARPRTEDPAYIAAILPSALRAEADKVFYADTVDLECKGTFDFVAAIAPKGAAGRRPRPVFVVYRSTRGGLDRILYTPMRVDGVEEVAVAADLTGSGKRDLVTIGSDEGGYLPRVFRWSGRTYVEVAVPNTYRLRQEAQWGPDCMRKINPVAVGHRSIRLLRETISPKAVAGHGVSCSLPADTLRLVGDSLVRAH
jgi:hypothetical protein